MPNQTRGLPNDRIIIIGENFNATRKIRATSPRVQEVDGRTGIAYTDLDGTRKLLDCTDVIPDDAAERHSFMIPHVAQALRNKDLDYITYAIKAQERGRRAHHRSVRRRDVGLSRGTLRVDQVPRRNRAVDHRHHRRHRFLGFEDHLRRSRSP